MSTERLGDTPTEDPIRYFLDDMQLHGKKQRTCEAYKRVLRQFQQYIGSEEISTIAPTSVREATHRHCMAWVHSLRQSDCAESTIATYASYVHRFYTYLSHVGLFDSNPMTLVLEEMNEQIETNPSRRETSIDTMREFVHSVQHPLSHAIIIILLKSGMRSGELCNLDMRDINLSASETHDTRSIQPRAALDGRCRSMYVDTAPTAGQEYNGEIRTASNKRNRPTVIPLDDEAEMALSRWLLIRPDTVSDAEPLFVSTADQWGKRLTPHMVHHRVESHAAQWGWHRLGGDAAENVTPHYFRHFFTTYLRDRTGDRGVVKYLRGDVGGDIIDTYTHNWGNQVREKYLEHIYAICTRSSS